MSFTLPIEGDIIHAQHRKEQRPIEEFIPVLQAVLDDPTIKWVSWRQYTPHFNDGDPCVFGIHSLNVLPVGLYDSEDAEDEASHQGYLGFPPYNDPVRSIIGHRGWREGSVYEGPDEERYNRLVALSDAVTGGEFYDVLLTAFGDHAEVKVVPNDKIYVEFCEHD